MDERFQLRVLVADPEGAAFEAISRVLKQAHGDQLKIEQVAGSDAFLAALEQGVHDVAFMSHPLGPASALEVLASTSGQGCQVPVVVLLDEEEREIAASVIKAGAADFLMNSEIDARTLERVVRYATKQRQTERELAHLANYDLLTGLANRSHFRTHLERAIAFSERSQGLMALMFVDLDDFKGTNETLGHSVGDRVLVEVANRLQRHVRLGDALGRRTGDDSSETMGRLGGDEFMLLLTRLLRREDAAVVAERMLALLGAPITIGTDSLVVTGSIGIALYPDDGTDAETLLRNADAAMDEAKAAGKNRFQFYRNAMTQGAVERLTLRRDLAGAPGRRELFVEYQPQLDLRTGRIEGIEALLRWQHPQLGLLPPMRFVPLAEERGQINAIGQWVLEEVCRRIDGWRDSEMGGVRTFVNVSARQCTEGLLEVLEKVLHLAGLDPSLLGIEVTEGLLMQEVETAAEALQGARELGVAVALDDFGSGYFSFSSLKKLPVDIIKLDRTFVKDVAHNREDRVVLRAMISMAHALGCTVVAEGVETVEQAAVLYGEGCDRLQGFLIGRPVAGTDVEALKAALADGPWGRDSLHQRLAQIATGVPPFKGR